MQEEIQKASKEICKVDQTSLSLSADESRNVSLSDLSGLKDRGIGDRSSAHALISSSLVASSFTISGWLIRAVASFLFVSFVRDVVLCVNFCYGRFF